MQTHAFKLSTLLIGASLIFAGCSGGGETTTEDTTAPEETVAEDTSSVAQDSPEAVVETFFALFAEDPESALQVVDPAVVDTEDFQETWDEVKSWEFNNVEVLQVEENFVEISMEVVVEGETDSGTDEVEVVEKDGMWWVVDIPS